MGHATRAPPPALVKWSKASKKLHDERKVGTSFLSTRGAQLQGRDYCAMRTLFIRRSIEPCTQIREVLQVVDVGGK